MEAVDGGDMNCGMPRLATAIWLTIGAFLAGGAMTLIAMAFWPEVDPWR